MNFYQPKVLRRTYFNFKANKMSMFTCTMHVLYKLYTSYSCNQGCNARKVNCGYEYFAYILKVETSSLWAEFVNKNRCISVRLVSEEDKSI